MQVSPHPLDFDWRFEGETVDAICALLPRHGRVLALGAPTVAQRLERNGCEVMLIDRQPQLGVSSHLRADLETIAEPVPGFVAAIVDPPWYPDDLIYWTRFAGACVGARGKIITSVWPENTRPEAEKELETAIDAMSEWAQVTRLPIVPKYHIPLFERRAIEAGGLGQLSVSPRKGILLQLSIMRIPEKSFPPSRLELWRRFIINDYQLALRLSRSDPTVPKVLSHPNAIEWHWPFVSARAPGRSEIDLWSSEGEVARVEGSLGLADLLRRALATSDIQSFLDALASTPELLSWKIPRPPYRSLIEWQHQQ